MQIDERARAEATTLERSQATSRPAVTRIIRRSTGWGGLRLGELWEYRDLLYLLIWRDVKVRYKQTVLGIAWAIIQPFVTMVIFSIFFGRLASLPSNGVPYPIFAYSALVPWTYFAGALTNASNSLVAQERLITKIYFPRLLVPLASVLGGLIDLGIAFLVLVGMLFYYGRFVFVMLWAVPLLVLLAATAAFAVGLWLAALNVLYRDVRYAVPFLIQFWLFVTPVVYPSSLVPATWRPLYALNPMAGVIDGFRWALLGDPHPVGLTLAISTAMTLLILVGGLVYFRRMERSFADVI